jgi:hypothetical protein
MAKLTDTELNFLTDKLQDISYANKETLADMSETYKNSLMAEQLRFMLATKELDPKPTSQEVLDEVIGVMLSGAVTMSWADGITLPNVVGAVVSVWNELDRQKKSKMN